MSDEKLSGFGSFFYPPSKIQGDLEEYMDCAFFGRPIKVDVQCSDDFRVLVTDDCFVCPITQNYADAFDFMNVLFAIFVTKFHRARFITKDDLCYFEIENNKKLAHISTRISKSLRSLQEWKREDKESHQSEWLSIERQTIYPLLMKRLIQQAYSFFRKPDYKTDSLLIGESSGLFQDGLYQYLFFCHGL